VAVSAISTCYHSPYILRQQNVLRDVGVEKGKTLEPCLIILNSACGLHHTAIAYSPFRIPALPFLQRIPANRPLAWLPDYRGRLRRAILDLSIGAALGCATMPRCAARTTSTGRKLSVTRFAPAILMDAAWLIPGLRVDAACARHYRQRLFSTGVLGLSRLTADLLRPFLPPRAACVFVYLPPSYLSRHRII